MVSVAIAVILSYTIQNMEEKSWPAAVLSGVGKFMYNIIMRDIKIDVSIAKMNSKTE
jgi:DNA-directed RNA polymerase